MADKTCFVIAPIGESGSDTRKRSDQVLKHVISPAISQCSYKAVRADQISEPGMITSQVIQHIVDDDLVVADLTERNPNVFYELAIRHAIQKPLVQIIKKGEQIPFDVAGTRTIHVDHHDLDSVEAARKEIINQIKSVEKDPSKLETPISVSLDLQLLRQSDDPERRSLADILSEIAEIRSYISKIEKHINSPETRLQREYFQQIIKSKTLKKPSSKKLITELSDIADQLYELLVTDKPKDPNCVSDAAHLVKMMRHNLTHYEVY